jgi:pimeloyl-ACP methyl ester carboxylesterase
MHKANGMETHEVSFGSGNRVLSGRRFDEGLYEGGRRGVLFVHGQQSSQEGYKDRAKSVSHSLDAVCLTFDLSGHGQDSANFDRYTVYDHLQDVKAAYDSLISFGVVNPERVGVCGASYGGYLAALLTASRTVKRLVLRAPSLPDAMHATQGPHAGEGRAEIDSIKVLSRYRGIYLSSNPRETKSSRSRISLPT